MNRYKKLILTLLLCGLTFRAQAALAAPSPATGVFWQINTARLATFSDTQLAHEVSLLKRAGFDTLIIQYTAQWDSKAERYQSFVPNEYFSVYPQIEKRDPLAAIFKAAQAQQVKVIVGDFLAPPDIRYKNPQQAFGHFLSQDANNYRRALLEKYKDSPAFDGYYIANEPNPRSITSEQKLLWMDATRQVAKLVKSIKPDLVVVHSIGLYAQWLKDDKGVEHPYAPTAEYLDAFWRDWVKDIPEIDAWMVIDGIGTSMASLKTTDVAQQWGAKLTHEYDKQFWVDVENAVMGRKGHYPFPLEKLQASLDVAAKHADKIVLFEYLNYMSPNNGRAEAQNLYLDYLQYFDRKQADSAEH
jgi:hypothetical protein